MTAAELIRKLSEMPPEADVRFVYDYGDHSHTDVTQLVDDVEEGVVEFSEYHRMQIVAGQEDEEADEKPGQEVILLRSRR